VSSTDSAARPKLPLALAVGVLVVALRGRDVWVVWPVHFVMDMMQFAMIGRQP
jgi:hypothetical protein